MQDCSRYHAPQTHGRALISHGMKTFVSCFSPRDSTRGSNKSSRETNSHVRNEEFSANGAATTGNRLDQKWGDKLQLGFFFYGPPLRFSAETIKDELQPAGKVLQLILIDRARLSVPLSSHIN